VKIFLSPLHVDEILFGRHKEIEDAFDELGLFHDFLESLGRE
jgi:hypothetical protein